MNEERSTFVPSRIGIPSAVFVALLGGMWSPSCNQDIRTLTGNLSELPARQGRLVLDPFLDELGRILSVTPASARAVPAYGKSGLLQGLAYDNGYYDRYLYDESSEWVDVLRTNAEGVDVKAYSFDLRNGFVDVWEATRGESVRTWIDLGDQTFATLFVPRYFDQTAQSHFGDVIAIGDGGHCGCQYGDDHDPCKGHKTKAACETQEDARQYKGDKKNCVWISGADSF